MGLINSAKIAWKQDGITRLEDEIGYYEKMKEVSGKGGKEELQLTIDRMSNQLEKAKEELEELEG